MIMLRVFILLLSYSGAMSKNENDLISVIFDFIHHQKEPTHITVFHCWQKSNIFKFSKTLSRSEQIRILNANSDQIFYLQPEEYQLILLDLGCEGSVGILETARDLKLFRFPFRWLFWGENSVVHHFIEVFFLDSRIYLIIGNTSKYRIESIYKLNNKTIVNEISTLSSTNRNSSSRWNDFSLIRNRTNLEGANMTISYVITNDVNSEKHMWDYRDRDKDTMTKISYIVLYYIIEMMNGTTQTIAQNTWGYLNASSKSFNGMIGDLERLKADFSGTPSLITVERMQVVDYISISTPATVKFIFRKPPLSYAVNVYAHPLNTYVWIASISIITLTLSIIYIIAKWEGNTPEVSAETISSNLPVWYRPNIFDVIIMQIGATTQQGTEFEPRSVSGRIATFFLFIMLMFLYTAYSANIVVLLQSFSDSIRTPRDLLTSRIKLGAEDTPFNRHFLETEREKLRRHIFVTKMSGNTKAYITAEEGIKKVQNEFFAFHTEANQAYQLVSKTFKENEKCGITELDFLNIGTAYLAVRKNSTIKQLARVKFRWLHESGIRRCQFHRFYEGKPKCSGRVSNFVSVDLHDCYAPCLIFVLGVTFSLVLMLCEILLNKYYTLNAKII